MEEQVTLDSFVEFINRIAEEDKKKLKCKSKEELIDKAYEIERKNDILKGIEKLLLEKGLTLTTLSRLMKYPHLISNLYLQFLQDDHEFIDSVVVKELIGCLLNKNISRL